MFNDEHILIQQLTGILDSSKFKLSDVLPTVWAEEHMRITTGKYQGKLSYNLTPHWKEIADNLSPYSGVPEVVLMGNAQGGKTKAIIEAIINYYINQHPRNIGYFTGHTDLSEDSMISLDAAIEGCGNKNLIYAQSQRKRNGRTGDTNRIKEFPLGKLWAGSASNHKLLRQKDMQFIIADDIEAANTSSKKSGSTVSQIRLRTNSFGLDKKIFWCSTPELETDSIILPLYLSGDQRKRLIPCQCCGLMIELIFDAKADGGDAAGLTWKLDEAGKLRANSVEYICQSCGRAFDEKNKYEFNLAGIWHPTNPTPDSPNLVSYHMSGLYSPPGMDDWEVLVREYLSANPPGQPVKEKEMQTFVNLRLGLPYKPEAKEMKATKIMENTQPYQIGMVPEKLSIDHGNGNIILLTCGSDLNGTMRGVNGADVCDARLDYEILAHSETGATYSITHGSIGTFIPRENTLKGVKVDRKKWTYEHNKENSVWPEFEKLLRQTFKTDTGREMKIALTGLDCGAYATNGAYPFLDKTNNPVVGVKGDPNDRYLLVDANMPVFKLGLERAKLHILQVGIIKDRIAEYMQLNWQRGKEEQPPNFMNYPMSDGVLYQKDNFFLHYEAENRVERINTNGATEYRWQKKGNHVQNHLFDCRVYNLAIRDIYLYYFIKMASPQLKEKFKNKQFTWADLVEYYRANTQGKAA